MGKLERPTAGVTLSDEDREVIEPLGPASAYAQLLSSVPHWVAATRVARGHVMQAANKAAVLSRWRLGLSCPSTGLLLG